MDTEETDARDGHCIPRQQAYFRKKAELREGSEGVGRLMEPSEGVGKFMEPSEGLQEQLTGGNKQNVKEGRRVRSRDAKLNGYSAQPFLLWI